MVLGYCLFDLSEWHRMLTSDCASWSKAILSYWSTSCVKGGRVIPRRRQVPTFERRVFALTMKTDTFVLKGFFNPCVGSILGDLFETAAPEEITVSNPICVAQRNQVGINFAS